MLKPYRHALSRAVLVLGAVASCREALDIEDLPEARVVPETDGGDAQVEGDGGAGTGDSCKGLVPAPTFCANFDDEGDIKRGWDNASAPDNLGIRGGGVIESETTFVTSPPRAVAFSTPAGENGTTPVALVWKTIPRLAAKLEVEFSMRVETESFPGKGTVVVTTLGFGPVAKAVLKRGKSGVELATFIQGSTLEDVALLNRPLEVGAWKRIRFVLTNDADGGAGRLAVFVDGAEAASLPAPAVFGTEWPSVWLGPVNAAGAFRAQVDDVRIYLTPR